MIPGTIELCPMAFPFDNAISYSVPLFLGFLFLPFFLESANIPDKPLDFDFIF